MKNRILKVFLLTLALSVLALSFCALAYADGATVTAPAGQGSFDVWGDGVSATAGGAGFRTWLRIEDGDPYQLGQGTFSFGQEYGAEEISVTLSASTAFNGKAILIGYSIRNDSDYERMVRVGSCGNTALGGDDGAAVYARGGGFVSENGGLSVLIFPGDYVFDGSWCGAVGTNSSKLCYTDQNCDVSWYWYLKLQPGQTATRSVVIAAGAVQRCSIYLDPRGGQTLKYEAASRQERLAIRGAAYVLPPAPFVKSGCRFLGWSVSPDADEPNYTDEGIVPASQVYDNLLLYAFWEDKSLQHIEAEDLTIHYGDQDAHIRATSTDGKLSYAVKSGFDVLAVDADSGAIKTIKPGTAVVTVTAAPTNDYNAAQKDVTVTVLQKTLENSMLTLTPDRFDYDGKAKKPTIAVTHGDTALLAGRDYEFDASSVLTATALGEYRITVNGLGYYSGSASAVWKITKLMPSVTVTANNRSYDGTAKPLVSVPAQRGGTLQFSLNRDGPYSEAIPTATAAGSYTVWYRIVGDETWLDLPAASRTVTIARKEVAVSGITARDKFYDGGTNAELVFDKAVIAGVCGGDEVYVRSASGIFEDENVAQNLRVSISAITLGGASARNYTPAPAQQQTETSASITLRPITIRAKDQMIPMNGSITQGVAQVTVEGAGLSGFDSLTSISLVRVPAAAGEAADSIVPSSAAIVRRGSTRYTTSNYAITYAPGAAVVDPIELKLTWSDTEFVYDGKPHRPTATVSGTLGGEVLSVTVTGAKTAANPEGESYTAEAVALTGINARFYKLPEKATQEFTILPKSLEEDSITVEYRPDDDPTVIGPVPADGRSYGFKSITVYDGTRKLVKGTDYTLEGNYSAIFGPHTLRIIGKGNYKDSLSREWTLVGNGMVSASVEVKNGAAPVYWTNASEALAEALMDEGDRWVREEYGAPTDVYLQIRPAVTSSGIAAKAGQLGETVGANYDLSLYKRVGNSATLIHDTGGRPITITLDVPEELRKAPVGFYRSFSLIHLHDGSAEVLAQGTGSSFSFTTTRFSAYAISYRDIALPPNSSPPTGDAANLPLWSTLLLLSAAGLLVLTRRRKKKT